MLIQLSTYRIVSFIKFSFLKKTLVDFETVKTSPPPFFKISHVELPEVLNKKRKQI